jgi:hypothetical protein
MVYVLLEESWTDRDGNRHVAGDTVDVDAATLAELQAQGVAADPGNGSEPAGGSRGGEDEDDPDSWPGPTGGDDEDPDSWPGPTGGDQDGTDSWAGPTGGDDS